MELSSRELLQIYESMIKPFGHPDPLGFITRVLLLSGGDPDYIDSDGNQGFMPVMADVAIEMTGVPEVQTLQNNLTATLTIDRLYFESLTSVDRMIIAFHFSEEEATGTLTNEHLDFLNDVNEGRKESLAILYPPIATVENVIELLNEDLIDERLSTNEKSFFKTLLEINR